MSTVKFSKQEELNKLQAKIMLDTGIKLSKKELLEIVFDIGCKNYDEVLPNVRKLRKSQEDSSELREQFINNFSGCIELD